MEMEVLHDLERALALHNEGERLRQEYVRALSERAAAEEELRQVEDLIATLTPRPLMRPELLSPRPPQRPEPMRLEITIRVEQPEQPDEE